MNPTPRRKQKIRLGVNIDHAATLRQVRGGTTSYPDLLSLAKISQKAGADQITIHLREDRRHIQERDVVELTRWRGIPINLEMGATSQMLDWALRTRPNWVCLVPEKRAELTTEGGLDVAGGTGPRDLAKLVGALKKKKILISGFIEADVLQIEASASLGLAAIEFHTGAWCGARGANKKLLWKKLVAGAELAHSLGLRVHAGHGLDFQTAAEICRLPYLQEINVGHSLICYALEMGLGRSVRQMKTVLERAPRF